jgi:hypothetical protein
MKIAIDFDGTCVKYDYPFTGADIGAVPVLRELVEKKHQLILYTMRTGLELKRAEQWFMDNRIELFGVQYDPEQTNWTSSNKCYAHLYIDDAALGIPLIHDEGDKKPYVDWNKVRELLVEKGIL